MKTQQQLPYDSDVEISVICPVGKHVTELESVHREFHGAILRTGRSAEFIYVVDGPWTGAEPVLSKLEEERFPIRVFTTAKGFGEATALQFGFERARGRLILTIPDRPQIDADVILRVLAGLDQGQEVVITCRSPRTDAMLNQLQSRAFHGLVRILVGHNFKDLSCGVRGFTADAARKLDLYGDQHRFIPVIAAKLGYRVTEISARQHTSNESLRLRGFGIYTRRLLDILNIYFLTKFTRKPLRFFGLVGMSIGGLGFAISAYLAVQRLLRSSPLADRPLLILGILLIVLGVQVMSIGLLGEIIIFLSAKRDEPEIEEVHFDRPADTPAEHPATAHRDS